MNTIGAYYENSLDQVMNPGRASDGSDGYFIPDASGSMDCPTLKTNFDKIDNQIQYWYGILQTGDNNSRELENLNKIINVLKTKKDYYSTLMLRNCSTATTTTAPPDDQVTDSDIDIPQDQLPQTPATGNNSNLIWLAVAGFGVYLISKNKGKRKKVKGMGDDNTALILSGGTYLLMYFREKRSSTPPITEPIAVNEPVPTTPQVESGPIPEPIQYQDTNSIPAGTFKGEEEMPVMQVDYSTSFI
jgi:hypothetical protein